MGWSLCAVGDLDGDSVADLASACLRDADGTQTGDLWIVSGKTGKTLRVVKSASPSIHLGDIVAGIGDVNGDGVADICADGPAVTKAGAVTVGAALVLSGKDGTLLRGPEGPGFAADFSLDGACKVGDWDKGGRPDYAISSAGSTVEVAGGSVTGVVIVMSAETGKAIRTIRASADQSALGGSMMADRNADGTPGPWLFIAEDGGHRVARYAAAEGRPKYLEGEEPMGDGMGAPMAWLCGKDAPPVLVVGAPWRAFDGDPGPGAVRAFDGRTLKALYSVASPDGGPEFGKAVASVGDLDGDGTEDFVAGDPKFTPPEKPSEENRGRAYVLSGRTGKLISVLGPAGREEVAKPKPPK